MPRYDDDTGDDDEDEREQEERESQAEWEAEYRDTEEYPPENLPPPDGD